MSMTCPRCRNVQLVERRATPPGAGAPFTLYACEVCKGLWLDAHVQAALCPTVAHLPERSLEVSLLGRRGEGISSCPRCQVAPVEFTVLDVPIDLCTRCGGVWLDGDEYEERMVSAPGAEVHDAGGPYRRGSRAMRVGVIDCKGCGAPVSIEASYMRDEGLVCKPCNSREELRADQNRAGPDSLGTLLRKAFTGLMRARSPLPALDDEPAQGAVGLRIDLK